MNLNLLTDLLRCHAAPGDESEVRELMTAQFRKAGWPVQEHGHYAITAKHPGNQPGKPTILVTAHMDSPGYTVEKMDGNGVTCVTLGGPRFPGAQAEVLVKTGKKKRVAQLQRCGEGRDATYTATVRGSVTHGDRACFRAAPQIVCDEYVLSPFLDNRLGCFILCTLAHEAALQGDLPVNLLLGATTTEEMGGFGAPVLARETAPDLAICLDATYEDEEQNVIIGNGPVLTLSDASVILSCAARDAVLTSFKKAGLPIQTEVYNYSGTDARAFPHQGLTCPVFALLIPTVGNHSPVERASLNDVNSLCKALKMWMLDGSIAHI